MSSSATWRLVGVLAPFMLSAYAVFSISMVVEQLAASFHVSIDQVLVAIPVDFIGGAVGGVALGHLADRYGRRLALLISGVLFSVFVLLASAVSSIWEIYVLWFFVGMGVNSQNGVAYPVVVETLRSATGLVGGLMQGLYFIGFLLDVVTYHFVPSWRPFFLAVGLISLIPTLATTPLVAETARRGVARRAGLTSMGRRLALITVALSLVTLGAFMFSVPLLGVVPTLLDELHVAGPWLALLSTLGFAGFIIAGFASDRLGRATTALLFSAIGLASSAALAATAVKGAVLASLALMFLFSGYFSFTGIWASETYPMEFRATATNLVFLVGRLVGGFSAYIAGSIYPPSLRVGIAVTCVIADVLAVVGSIMYMLLVHGQR